jgi:hypothetical protein
MRSSGDSRRLSWNGFRERSQGTVSEFDSLGCQLRSLNSWARARSGYGALDRVLGKGNWCIQIGNCSLAPSPFPDPVFRFHAEARRARRSEDWILSANSASPRETLYCLYSRVWRPSRHPVSPELLHGPSPPRRLRATKPALYLYYYVI